MQRVIYYRDMKNITQIEKTRQLAAVGQTVMCNGHPGMVVKVHDGQLAGMVDVRLESGLVCTDSSELKEVSLGLSEPQFFV